MEQVYGITRVTVEGDEMVLEFVRTDDGAVSDVVRLQSQW